MYIYIYIYISIYVYIYMYIYAYIYIYIYMNTKHLPKQLILSFYRLIPKNFGEKCFFKCFAPLLG